MNAKLTTTTTTQPANKELDKKETVLYYLIVETKEGKTIINIGKKTHDKVKELIK